MQSAIDFKIANFVAKKRKISFQVFCSPSSGDTFTKVFSVDVIEYYTLQKYKFNEFSFYKMDFRTKRS